MLEVCMKQPRHRQVSCATSKKLKWQLFLSRTRQPVRCIEPISNDCSACQHCAHHLAPLKTCPVFNSNLLYFLATHNYTTTGLPLHNCPAGPEDVTTAKQQVHNSIRGLFAKDLVHLAALGSDSPASAARHLDLFFGSNPTAGKSITGSCRLDASTSPSCHAAARVQSCCRCSGTSLGVILPHAVKDGIAGLMLEEIQTSCQVTALQLFNLNKPAAAEFLEVSNCNIDMLCACVSCRVTC